MVRNVRLRQRMEIPDGDPTDWLCMREGKMVGNRTARALFDQMPAAEVERLRGMLAP